MAGAGRQRGNAALIFVVVLLALAAFPPPSAAVEAKRPSPDKKKCRDDAPQLQNPRVPQQSTSAGFSPYRDGLSYVAINATDLPKPSFLVAGSPTSSRCDASRVPCTKERGNACLVIVTQINGGVGDFVVITEKTMQDLMIMYDKEIRLIGLSCANCERFPSDEKGFCQPQLASSVILANECPASFSQ